MRLTLRLAPRPQETRKVKCSHRVRKVPIKVKEYSGVPLVYGTDEGGVHSYRRVHRLNRSQKRLPTSGDGGRVPSLKSDRQSTRTNCLYFLPD